MIFMKEGHVERRKPILFPFLVGGVIGAGVAFLLAPKPGRELRKDIKRLATDARGRVTLAMDRGKAIYEEGRLAVNKAVDRGKEIYDEGRVAVNKAIDAGKAAYVQEKEKWQHA